MANYIDYFDRVREKPTWFIGDRVSGKAGKTMFIGTVLNEHTVTEEEGPRVIIDLDLPLNGSHIIISKPKQLKRLKNYGD